MEIDTDDILDKIMYGDLDDNDNETLEMHDCTATRKEKFMFKRMNMDYYMKMCRATNGFHRRHHMSENAYHKLVDILRNNIQLNIVKSKNGSNVNEYISPEVVTCIG